MGLKGKAVVSMTFSIALACAGGANEVLAAESGAGFTLTAAQDMPNEQERGRPGAQYGLPGSAGAQSYGKQTPGGLSTPSDTTPPSGSVPPGEGYVRGNEPGAEPPSVRDEEESLRREPGAGAEPALPGQGGGRLLAAGTTRSAAGDQGGETTSPGESRSGPGANEPGSGYGARTDMATEKPGEAGSGSSELPPGAPQEERRSGAGEARILPEVDPPRSGGVGGANETRRLLAAGQIPESTNRETGRSDELMRRAKESGNAQSGASVGTERESGGRSDESVGSGNSGWTAQQPGERVVPPGDVLRSREQGSGEATGAPGDAMKRRSGPANVDEEKSRLLAASEMRQPVTGPGAQSGGTTPSTGASGDNRLDRLGEGGSGAAPGWGGSGESGTSDAAGQAWTASPPASGVERGLGTTSDPDQTTPPPPGGLSNQPPFSGTGPAGSSRVYESGPVPSGGESGGQIRDQGGTPGRIAAAPDGPQDGLTRGRAESGSAGTGGVGNASGTTQTISGVAQKVGQGVVLIGSDGQRYDLVMSGGQDASNLDGRRVTVTGEVTRSDLPASGAAGAVSSRNVIRVTRISE